MNIVETLGLKLKFSPPKVVMTKFGERKLSTAPATEEFWTAWRASKDEMKKAGISVSKNEMNGKWQVAYWEEVMAAEDRAAALAASRAQDASIELPLPPGQELYPFQRAGVAYAMSRPATLIADEMGLGKTVQAIVTANTRRAQRILVIAPASLLANWRNEIGRWQTLDLPVHVIRPGVTCSPNKPGWYVINFEILHNYPQLKANDWDRYPHTDFVNWDLVIIDECHRLKSSAAKRTRWIMGGRALPAKVGEKPKEAEPAVEPIRGKCRLLLTGTPICNRPREAYTLLHYLDPARWASKSSFEKRYCRAYFNGHGYDANGASNLDELQDRMRMTVMVRRLKKDVLTELPAKMRQVVLLEIPEEAQEAVNVEIETYERTRKAVEDAEDEVDRLRDGDDEDAYRAAVGRLKAARAVAFSEMALVRHDTAVAKIPAVVGHLRAVEDGKVIVFAYHKDVVRALVSALTEEGVVSITGETPVHLRQEAVERFQTDPKCRFFVGNIMAAGVGLTLTASSHVVFAELDWVPGNVTQAEDRAHRIGQRDTVLVQHLVLDGSLDSKMAKTIIAKQQVIEQALDNETAFEYAAYEPKQSNGAGETEQQAQPEAKPEIVLTEDQVAAIHAALRVIASFDEDRARSLNDIGFSAADTDFGCSLAARGRLTTRQAAIGMKIVRKYRRQYGMDLYVRIFGEEWKK